MKKLKNENRLLKYLIFIIICLGLIFSISFKANNQDELQIVYKKVEKYFKSNDNSELRRNCVAFSLDKKIMSL